MAENHTKKKTNTTGKTSSKSKKEDALEKEISTEVVDKTEEMASILDTQEIHTMKREMNERNENEINSPVKKHILTTLFLLILLVLSFVSFGMILVSKEMTISDLIRSLLLTIFTLLFVVTSITYRRKNKAMVFLSSLFLIGYFIYGFYSTSPVSISIIDAVPNFSGKSITRVIEWADKNHITIHQEYEYSDMIEEYTIISQDIPSGTDLKDIDEITISISEGPNPSKEIMVPNMVSWDDERVISYILENHMSNVEVEFVESDQAQDTVIEQSASGNLRRDEYLKLTFSYGEELGYSEVTLIDFKNKTKFEVEFYMKQHQLRYDFDDAFDSKIKRGFATKQSIEAGEIVHVDDERITVTISKGPEIKVPNLLSYSMTEITEWAIKNRVKLNFSDGYDDTIKENQVISANYQEGDIIEQGTVVKVVISRGSLKMPKFASLNDFYTWANKYGIHYEEKHEFSDTVAAGEVISYSYKSGQAIKNNDTIIVTISDGVKKSVPDVVGLTKSEASSKLNKAGLKYSFVYRNSSEKKDIVINQSIKAGSEISGGTTITIMLSNGKTTEERKENNSNNQNNNNNNNNNDNSNNNDTPTPEPTYEEVTVYIYDELIKNSPTSTCSAIKNVYSKLTFSCSYVCGPYNGALVNSSSIDEHTFKTNETVLLKISDDSKC